MAIGINSTDISEKDARIGITSTGSSKIGRDVTWDWLRKNYDDIKQYFGEEAFLNGPHNLIGAIIMAITSDFNTILKLEEINTFYECHINDLKDNRDIIITIQGIKANINWVNNSYKTVINWFRNQNQNSISCNLFSLMKLQVKQDSI